VRWLAPHPDWDPQAAGGSSGDWPQLVGCVLYELPEIVVLIDPLIPSDRREAFLRWLDDLVAARAVTILTTIHWHRRSREELAQRYRSHTSRAWNVLPAGVERRPIRGAGETLFWLGAAATLVVGDRLIGVQGDAAGHQLRVCPQSWLTRVRADRADVAGLMRPLLELPIERVLVSHGEPVLHGGHLALADALAEASAG